MTHVYRQVSHCSCCGILSLFYPVVSSNVAGDSMELVGETMDFRPNVGGSRYSVEEYSESTGYPKNERNKNELENML